MSDGTKRQHRIFPQISVYLPDVVLDVVEQLAADEDKKRSEIIRDLVTDALTRRGLLAA